MDSTDFGVVIKKHGKKLSKYSVLNKKLTALRGGLFLCPQVTPYPNQSDPDAGNEKGFKGTPLGCDKY